MVMRFGVLQNYYSRAVQVRTTDVQSQMKILADHLAMAETLGLEKDMVQSLFEATHKASVDRQARLDT